MDTNKKFALDHFNEKMDFQGRLERLDWKRIASIDIDNLIREGDTSQLVELISSVTFCKADSEFDHGRIDPGFIKVFRLSQLISEYLLHSREKFAERLSALENKHNETEKERVKLSEENLHLKESLAGAKKELKKRKEMIASAQGEMLGQNNGDEYDQCPYCSKKFLSSGFLLAHIQRRHQGLPANPLYSSFPPSGGTAVAMLPLHHPPAQHQHQQQQHLLACTNPQQQRSSGSYDSLGIHQPSPLQVHTALQTPASSSVVTPGMPHFAPNGITNPSISGSVTSLNQMHLNGNGNENGPSLGIIPNANFSVVEEEMMLTRRDSFTQTTVAIEKLTEEKSTQALLEQVPENPASTWDMELSRGLESPKTQILKESESKENKKDQMESSRVNSLEENTQPLCGNGNGGGSGVGDGDAGSGSQRSWKRVLEETEMNVMRMQDELLQRCKNLEEKVKQGQKEMEERNNALTPIVSSQVEKQKNEDNSTSTAVVVGGAEQSSHAELVEESEVVKSSSAILNEALLAEIVKRHEIEDLKNALQTTVHDEMKSLISRFETQEQFWQDKLAIVNENHEKQIQQLRDELQSQNSNFNAANERAPSPHSLETLNRTYTTAAAPRPTTTKYLQQQKQQQHRDEAVARETEDSQSDEDDEEDGISESEDDDEEEDEEVQVPPSKPIQETPKVPHKPPVPRQSRSDEKQKSGAKRDTDSLRSESRDEPVTPNYRPTPKPRQRRDSGESEKQLSRKDDESIEDAETKSITKKSPYGRSLGKIFSAVKTSGKKWKKRVMSLGHKKEKDVVNTSTANITIESRNDLDQKKENEVKANTNANIANNNDDENEEDSSSDSSSASDSEPFSEDSGDEEPEALTPSETPRIVSSDQSINSVGTMKRKVNKKPSDERFEEIKRLVCRRKLEFVSDGEEEDEEEDDAGNISAIQPQSQSRPPTRNNKDYFKDNPRTSTPKNEDDEFEEQVQVQSLESKNKSKDKLVSVSQYDQDQESDFDKSSDEEEEDVNETFTFRGKPQPGSGTGRNFLNDNDFSSPYKDKDIRKTPSPQVLKRSSPTTNFVVKKTVQNQNLEKTLEDDSSSDSDISYGDLLDNDSGDRKEIGTHKNNSPGNKTFPQTPATNANLRRGNFATGSIQRTSPMVSSLLSPLASTSDKEKGNWNRTFKSTGGRDSPSNNSWDSAKFHSTFLP